MQTFAFPIPFLVICELLGLRDEDRETFRRLGSARFDVTHGGQAVMGAVGASREFLFAECARQRTDPGPGLIGQIIREHGDEISDFDLGGLADGAFTGGLETLGLDASARHASSCSAVRDLYAGLVTDPASVTPVVEELLRHLSVVQVAFPRFTKAEVDRGRPTDPEGRRACSCTCRPPTATRARTPSRDTLDPDARQRLAPGVRLRLPPLCRRRARPHGAARGVPAPWRGASPTSALAVPADDLPYHAKSIVYGVESVPVRLHR